MTILPCIEIETTKSPSASVIWLHGLGANGHDFAPIVEELNLPTSLPTRFILPHAGEIPITINNGYIMPAWYDILEMGESRKINIEQLLHSVQSIHTLIDRERERGIAANQIFVIGFSQGGAVAYHAALTYPEKLAGVMGLSTYFPTADTIDCHASNLNIPIKIFHGSRDPMVVESLGRQAYTDLQTLGYQVDYKNYPIEHEVCQKEVSDISLFLQYHLKSNL